MTLGGLFSGIGGFELAAQWAGITPVWSNEIDEFCCKVLRKNFKHDIIQADIRDCGAGRKYELAPVDIICGGFPCQPFSTAGKRKGAEDNRYLWPEMLRTIREVKPRWVVGENVAGILSMDGGAVFEQICASLENEGYTVETYCIPACAVGAPHRRDRVWIVANARSNGLRGTGRVCNLRKLDERQSEQGEANRLATPSKIYKSITAHPNDEGIQRHSGHENGCSKPGWKYTEQNGHSKPSDWSKDWLQTATRICRMDDGVPRRVDRTNRLKALGNAIVPQVTQVIFEAILEVESKAI